jgi:hypothetical protein
MAELGYFGVKDCALLHTKSGRIVAPVHRIETQILWISGSDDDVKITKDLCQRRTLTSSHSSGWKLTEVTS